MLLTCLRARDAISCLHGSRDPGRQLAPSFVCFVGLGVANAIAEQEVLGSITGSGKVIVFFQQEFLSSNHGVGICTRLIAKGSPPIYVTHKTLLAKRRDTIRYTSA